MVLKCIDIVSAVIPDGIDDERIGGFCKAIDRFITAHAAKECSAEYFTETNDYVWKLDVEVICGEFEFECDGSYNGVFKLSDEVTICSTQNQEIKTVFTIGNPK